MNWLYSNAIGGVKLQVQESDVERSLEILGLDPSGTELGESEEDEKDDEWRCPNCDSLNVRFERYSKWGIFLPWLLLNFPLPFPKRKWKCAECGHEWKEKD
jgi:DNA-directed RNA polymerase subunit RPC12/RpoP